jgi:suppressor of G2 allele of SKP1
LGKYAEAKFCLNLAKEYDEKKNAKTVEMWLLKVKAKLTDSEQYIDKIPPLPEKPVDAIEPQTPTNDDEGKSNTDETSTSSNEQPKKQSTSIPEFSKPIAPKVAKLDPENVRNDYFQSATAFNVSLFLKGIPKETCNVQFEPTLVKIHCKQPADGSDFDYTLGPLFDEIVPGECSFKVFGTKLELTLKKANNETWKTLLSEEKPTNEDSLEAVRAALGKSKQADSGVQGILQSRKNWDKLAEDMLVANNDEKDDDPNAFFKALYNDADDDTRRAMMKSYIESNGTALSTNWNEVKQKKIDTSPPTGMEAKTWN